MFNISNFLNKFEKTIQSTEINLDTISGVFLNDIGVKIDPSQIEIKDYTVYLKTNPAVLNKIFIRKEKILSDINKLTNLKIADIKIRN